MGSSSQAGTFSPSDLDMQDGAQPCPEPEIHLQDFHTQDYLLHKWQLNAQLPPATPEQWRIYETELKSKVDGYAQVLFTSQTEAGEPWECCVAFADVARKGGMVVGHSPHTADVVLPRRTVSRSHALLEIAERGLVITDLNSTNGTYVDGLLLSPYDRRIPLAHGMEIILGDARVNLTFIR